MADVVIVGGGVIGLLSALELADRGLKPVVFDAPHRPCASWAGGGILSPLFPWRYSDAVNRLCVDATARYQALSARILEAGGPDPEVTVNGMLALSADPPADVRDWCLRHDVSAVPAEAGSVPLSLSTPGTSAWWFPELASVRNSRLLPGLCQLLAHRGVRRVMEPVLALNRRPEGIGVVTSHGRVIAPRVVIAAGAWSTALAAPLGVTLDITPVKGQMLLFDAPDGSPRSMVLTEQGYVIPRRDGRLLVGSTLEPAPESGLPTRAAHEQLCEVAERLVPALAGVVPVAQWAGLRPGTSRSAPVIDEIEEGVWLASGHYRNGLVSAPASARLLAELMCDDRPGIDPRPYSLSP